MFGQLMPRVVQKGDNDLLRNGIKQQAYTPEGQRESRRGPRSVTGVELPSQVSHARKVGSDGVA